eukprot:TRINITY_DN5527_c0_g1_i1.p1 TRINITY_DN5527_c0_g1~~TRINITY_DN5527_c0_g1_i1.p1  ORF type:complete len:571 (+),score=144.06 TRINITY_DN5527_c0_g1_i1:100-1713(+)
MTKTKRQSPKIQTQNWWPPQTGHRPFIPRCSRTEKRTQAQQPSNMGFFEFLTRRKKKSEIKNDKNEKTITENSNSELVATTNRAPTLHSKMFKDRKETLVDLPLGIPRDVWKIVFEYLELSNLAQISSTCIVLYDLVQRFVASMRFVSLRDRKRKCAFDNLDENECKRFHLDPECQEQTFELIMGRDGARETSWLDRRIGIEALKVVNSTSGLNQYISLASHFSALRTLHLDRVDVKDESLQNIFINGRLEELVVKHSQISSHSWTALAECCSQSLISLELFTEIDGNHLKSVLDNCLNLRHFKFTSVRWFFYPWQERIIWFPTFGKKLNKLETVYLKGLQFDSSDFEQFKDCKNLRRLHINNPFGLDAESITALLRCASYWSELECLECTYFSTNLKAADWKNLFEALPKLVRLAWTFYSAADLKELRGIPNNIESLEIQVDEKGNHPLSDTWESFINVIDLNYSGPMWDLPSALSKYLPNLKSLSVKWIGDADKGVDRFSREVPELQRIDVTDYREKIQAVKHINGFSSFHAPLW